MIEKDKGDPEFYTKKYNCTGPLTFKIQKYLNYFITISMQNISSIHPLILHIQQIVQSHDIKAYNHFRPCLPKNYQSNF